MRVPSNPKIRPSTMFVQLPARRRIGPRWATPLVCAALAAAFLWVGTRPESRQAALLLGWGALTGGPVAADTFHALWAEGRWLRLFTLLSFLPSFRRRSFLFPNHAEIDAKAQMRCDIVQPRKLLLQQCAIAIFIEMVEYFAHRTEVICI